MRQARGGAAIDGNGFQRGARVIHIKSSLVLTPVQVNIVTSFRYQQSWPVVIRLVSEGVLGDVTRLITHTFPMEKTIDAFETCADRTTLAIKVQIVDE